MEGYNKKKKRKGENVCIYVLSKKGGGGNEIFNKRQIKDFKKKRINYIGTF